MNVAFINKKKELLMPSFDKILSDCTTKHVLDLASTLEEKGVISDIRVGNITAEEGKAAEEMMLIGSGLGCNTKTVIEILSHRDARQRPMIRQAYQTMYADDLFRRLDSELRGNLKRAIILWMYDPADRDVVLLKDALAGAGTKDTTLIEIICSWTPSQLQLIIQAYHARYDRYVEKDVETNTSGHYQRLLLAYLSAPRYEVVCMSVEQSW